MSTAVRPYRRPAPVLTAFWWGRVGALLDKEWAGYFTTPLAYVFLTLFLLVAGVLTFFMGNFLERGQADLLPFFNFHPWLYLVFIPALSMRLIAEERKSGTLELLLTLPIGAVQAILAKFLACWLFCGLALLLTVPLWITVNYLGSPDNGLILASYLASWLCAAGFVAIGLFASALSRNQVTAFVVGVVLSFALLVGGTPLMTQLFAPWAGVFVVEAIAGLSMLTHFDTLTKGLITLKAAGYFVVLVVVFLCMAAETLKAEKNA
ncbi:MAG: ABC transporter permease subunit [Holosporales bacterium]